MAIEEFITRLGEDLKIDGLQLTNKMCRLVFDETIEVFIEYVPDFGLIFIHGVVGKAPGKDRGDVYRALLHGALFGVETAGAAFGVDNEQDELLLFTQLKEEGLEYGVFYDNLEAFTDRLEYWRAQMATLMAGDQDGGQDRELPVDEIPRIIRG